MHARIPLPILRFFASRDLPFAGALLARAGVWRHEPWRNEAPRSCRGRWHGYRMTLDLRDFHQRGAYLYGRLLDVGIQLLMREVLRPGDTFIDIGANIGVLTMLGSRLVGPPGTVHAFEPNPDVYRKLEEHLRSNGIRNVVPLPVALGRSEDTLTLSVPPTGNTGAASLGRMSARHTAPPLVTYQVRVRRGDDVLQGLGPAPMLIKLDVEGHETGALEGLRRTIEEHRPAIAAEVNPEMLACNDSSAAELLGLLAGMGYRAWVVGTRWSRWRRRWFLRLDGAPAGWNPRRTLNALFLHARSAHVARLGRWLAPAELGSRGGETSP